MTSQNSAQTRVTAQQLMTEFAVKKDTIYDDLKFLGIQSFRDEQGNPYINETQADLVRGLRAHVGETRRRAGFTGHLATEIATGESGAIVASNQAEIQQLPSENAPLVQVDFVQPESQQVGEDEVITAASVLAAHGMTLKEQVVLQVAGQMEYQDLLPGHQAKVDEIREACRPKGQAAAIATDYLTRHRQRNGAA